MLMVACAACVATQFLLSALHLQAMPVYLLPGDLCVKWTRNCLFVILHPCLSPLTAQAGFEASGHPAVAPALDLVEDEDQITHEMSLDDKHDPQVRLLCGPCSGCGLQSADSAVAGQL